MERLCSKTSNLHESGPQAQWPCCHRGPETHVSRREHIRKEMKKKEKKKERHKPSASEPKQVSPQAQARRNLLVCASASWIFNPTPARLPPSSLPREKKTCKQIQKRHLQIEKCGYPTMCRVLILYFFSSTFNTF